MITRIGKIQTQGGITNNIFLELQVLQHNVSLQCIQYTVSKKVHADSIYMNDGKQKADTDAK